MIKSFVQHRNFSKRVLHNFNAGPGILPKEVLKKAHEQLIDYNGMGISVLEMSHRQQEFQEITSKMLT